MGPAEAAVVAWLVAAMTSWAPPDAVTYKGGRFESHEARASRYEDTARAVSSVVYRLGYSPITSGESARAKDAGLALSIAGYEGGQYALDVDDGTRTGDGGKSFCLMQVNFSWRSRTAQGWTGPDLVGARNRERCFEAGLDLVRESHEECGNLASPDWLSGYTTGVCQRREPHAAKRMGRFARWLERNPVPVADEVVLAERASRT